MSASTLSGRALRRLVTGAAATVAVVLLTATQALAAAPLGTYDLFGTTTGSTFTVLSTRNLVHGLVDDQVFPLSTTGSGMHRLPFPLHLYNQTYKNIAISSNGNVQFGVTPAQASTTFVNDCLTTMQFGHPALLAYWDDLFYNSADTTRGFPQGIFTRVSGTAPHRTFLISWQGEENHGQALSALAQAFFTEGSPDVHVIYGTTGGISATIGIQAKQQLISSQWSCNGNVNPAETVGERIDLTRFVAN
jgi:hypothetical protein